MCEWSIGVRSSALTHSRRSWTAAALSIVRSRSPSIRTSADRTSSISPKQQQPGSGDVYRLARYRELNGKFAERAVLFEVQAPPLADAAAILRVGSDRKLYLAAGAEGFPGTLQRLNLDGTMPSDQAGTTPAVARDPVAGRTCRRRTCRDRVDRRRAGRRRTRERRILHRAPRPRCRPRPPPAARRQRLRGVLRRQRPARIRKHAPHRIAVRSPHRADPLLERARRHHRHARPCCRTSSAQSRSSPSLQTGPSISAPTTRSGG